MTKEQQSRKHQARARSWFHPQVYPGHGFDHNLAEIRKPAETSGLSLCLKCPCGQIISMRQPRESLTIIICPECEFWHVVRWK